MEFIHKKKKEKTQELSATGDVNCKGIYLRKK